MAPKISKLKNKSKQLKNSENQNNVLKKQQKEKRTEDTNQTEGAQQAATTNLPLSCWFPITRSQTAFLRLQEHISPLVLSNKRRSSIPLKCVVGPYGNTPKTIITRSAHRKKRSTICLDKHSSELTSCISKSNISCLLGKARTERRNLKKYSLKELQKVDVKQKSSKLTLKTKSKLVQQKKRNIRTMSTRREFAKIHWNYRIPATRRIPASPADYRKEKRNYLHPQQQRESFSRIQLREVTPFKNLFSRSVSCNYLAVPTTSEDCNLANEVIAPNASTQAIQMEVKENGSIKDIATAMNVKDIQESSKYRPLNQTSQAIFKDHRLSTSTLPKNHRFDFLVQLSKAPRPKKVQSLEMETTKPKKENALPVVHMKQPKTLDAVFTAKSESPQLAKKRETIRVILMRYKADHSSCMLINNRKGILWRTSSFISFLLSPWMLLDKFLDA